MAITKTTVAVDNITSLSSTPNATEGLTAAQLQAKFDKTGADLKTYINDTLTVEIDAQLAIQAPKSKYITAVRDMTLGNEDVSYTGVGFTPTSIQVLFGIGDNIGFGMGFCDSTKAGANMSQATDGLAYTEPNCFTAISNSSGNAQLAVVKSFDTDGFTLTWTKIGTPTGIATLRFLCMR